MKLIRVPELSGWGWIVAEFSEDKQPKITPFKTRDEARDYINGNRPSLLSKVKIYFERQR